MGSALDFDAIRREYAKVKQEQEQRGKFYKLQSGKNVIRLLPLEGGIPYRQVGIHYNLGFDEKSREYCPKLTAKKPCPVCEYVEELAASGSAADIDRVKKLRVKKRYFFNIIIRGEEKLGPRVLDVGETIWTGIVIHMADKDEKLDLTEVGADGYDVFVDKMGTGLNTEYLVRLPRKSSPLAKSKKTREEWKKISETLQNFVKANDYDKVKATLMGEEEEEVDFEDSDEYEDDEIEDTEEEFEEEDEDSEEGDEEEEEDDEDFDDSDILGVEEEDEEEEEEEEEEDAEEDEEDLEEEDFDVDEDTAEVKPVKAKSKPKKKSSRVDDEKLRQLKARITQKKKRVKK